LEEKERLEKLRFSVAIADKCPPRGETLALVGMS
jgi:hypothetical protein